MKLKTSVLLLFVISNFTFSQDQKEVDNTITAATSDIFSYQNQISSFLQLQQAVENTAVNNPLTDGNINNVAIIEQIGNNNVIQTDNFVGTSRLLYLQNGNRNSIVNQNNLNAVVTQRIVQFGNDNGINAISSGDLDIIQTGNGIIYEQIGTNAITNNLQLRLEGNARTVSVRTINVSN